MKHTDYATCTICNREMKPNSTCRAYVAIIHVSTGKAFKRLKNDYDTMCGDCNAKPGGYHHLGCAVERCPICGDQLISCDCWDGYRVSCSTKGVTK